MKLFLWLGVAAALFTAACVSGIVKNDPQTKKPYIDLEGVALPGSGVKIEELLPDGLTGWMQSIGKADVSLPAWPYAVKKNGLTVKALHAGKGEALLICCDGYTMLVGGGSGTGALLTAQLAACGVSRLSAAVASSSANEAIGAMSTAVKLMKPQYLFYQDSQIKGSEYNKLLKTAGEAGVDCRVPAAGTSFMLGSARVTFIGPLRTGHTDDRDDGLSLRIDHGAVSVLIAGGITRTGEEELLDARVYLDADLLICADGGSESATSKQMAKTVSPAAAWITGNEAPSQTVIRLERVGAKVYTMKEHGVMTMFSDGQNMEIVP